MNASVGFRPLGVYRRVGWKNDTWHDVAWVQKTIAAAEDPSVEPRGAGGRCPLASTVLVRIEVFGAGAGGGIVWAVPGLPLSLIEFPADDPKRGRRFWEELLGVELEARRAGEGDGWQTHSGAPAVGVHARGRGPGDSFSLPYFTVSDLAEALERVEVLGGSVVHPGQAWAICRDSEGSPFGLAQDSVEG